MKCPDCITEDLKARPARAGGDVDACPKCAGIWLEEGVIFSFIRAEKEMKAALAEALKAPCPVKAVNPRTGQHMQELRSPGGALFNICPSTRCVWIPGGALGPRRPLGSDNRDRRAPDVLADDLALTKINNGKAHGAAPLKKRNIGFIVLFGAVWLFFATLTFFKYYGLPVVLKEQLKKVFKAPAPDDEGLTGIHLAAARGEVADIGKFLAKGEGVNVRNRLGRTPIYEAAKRGRLDAVGFLMEKGANVNAAEGTAGLTPLHVASERGHIDVMRLLLKSGAKANARNRFQQTPLHQASWQGHEDAEAAKALVENGADVNARDNKGFTPLHMAARSGNAVYVGFLVGHGADPNAATNGGVTALDMAILNDYYDTARALVENGASVSMPASKGIPLLHIAVENGNADIARLLIEKGADVNAGYNGMTPLKAARKNGHKEVERLLLSSGAKE